MSEGRKRPVEDSTELVTKKTKFEDTPESCTMSLQCAECQGVIVDCNKGTKLSFLQDGTSLHLVLALSHRGEGTKVKGVASEKMPSERNPYASVSHVMCNNRNADGKICNKKVGGVKCYPPLSDNQLIFFSHKALLVDHVKHKTWKEARESSLWNVTPMPATSLEKGRQFKPRDRPPLVRTLDASAEQEEKGEERKSLTKTPPRPYQTELFENVLRCKRNSLVYLPTGLGKTLVAVMVLQKMLRLNPDRRAFFLVETNALALQQADALTAEMKCPVELMVGSSLSPGTDEFRFKMRLGDIRDAKVVVATAGAFEHAMCQKYIDPDSICCVVLDEAHHCSKDHPFNRVTKSFLTPRGADVTSLANPKTAANFPKLMGLTASPAGEKTLAATIVSIEELLERLGADLAAPVDTLEEVKARSPRVDLELVGVPITAPERILLGCLEKLVLSRILKSVHPDSDTGVQAKTLMDRMETRAKGGGIGSASVDDYNDWWRFPNKSHMALIQRAIMKTVGDGSGAGGAASSSQGQGKVIDRIDREGLFQLIKIVNLAFAIDEIGGEPTWRWVLEFLEGEIEINPPVKHRNVSETAVSDDSGDKERDDSLRVLRCYLPDPSSSDDEAVGEKDGPEVSVVGGAVKGRSTGLSGSKLETIATLMEEHKKRCDESGAVFTALVFVSTRDLAMATPGMLEAIPSVKPFVKARHIVGLLEMTPAEQRLALGLLKNGPVNVLISTAVCGEGIDVPACALVICASLPNSGTALVQLRGRIRCGENCRFLGLSRTCDARDQEQVKTICLRETNMLQAIERLSIGGGGGGDDTQSSSRGETARVGDSSSEEPETAGNFSEAGTSAAGSGCEGAGAVVGSATGAAPHRGSGEPVRIPTSGRAAPPASVCTVVPSKSAGSGGAGKTETLVEAYAKGGGGGAVGSARVAGAARPGGSVIGWKKPVPASMGSTAKRYAVQYLTTCVRQALNKNPDMMSRSTLHNAAQLAHTIKPVFDYDERKVDGEAHSPIFEARAIVRSTLEDMSGLIVMKEAKGTSIKAAREAAAKKVVQYLLSKESPTMQTPPA